METPVHEKLNLKGLADLRAEVKTRLRINRRSFLAGAAAAAVAPVSLSTAKTLGLVGFKVVQNDGTASILFPDGSKWTLDPKVFAGEPQLNVTEDQQGVNLTLTGACFPGTCLGFDLAASFGREVEA